MGRRPRERCCEHPHVTETLVTLARIVEFSVREAFRRWFGSDWPALSNATYQKDRVDHRTLTKATDPFSSPQGSFRSRLRYSVLYRTNDMCIPTTEGTSWTSRTRLLPSLP